MPSDRFRALARAITAEPGTPGTRDTTSTGSSIERQKAEDVRHVPTAGTRGTPGTPENDNAGGNDASRGTPHKRPPDAAGLLRHLRDDLHCWVTIENSEVTIRPAHRCPPATLAAAPAVSAELRALIEAEPPAWVRMPPATPEQAADEATDRAAIEAEAAISPTGIRQCSNHAAYLRALKAVAIQRPPSWPGADAVPSAGCWCSCCRGSRWWRERERASGWCCSTCHPPLHLPASGVVEVAT